MPIPAFGPGCAILGATLASAICTSAYGQDRNESYLAQHVRAPSDALELKVGSGYTQGFGNIAPGRAMDRVGGPGIGVGIEADYRLSRPWSIGVEGQYQELTNMENASSRGIAANLGATYHFEPVLRGDPWARLGSGYRMIWEVDPTGSPGVINLHHGFELLAAKIGYDVRVSEDLALAPVVGADLNMFVWEDPSNAPGRPMASPQIASFAGDPVCDLSPAEEPGGRPVRTVHRGLPTASRRGHRPWPSSTRRVREGPQGMHVARHLAERPSQSAVDREDDHQHCGDHPQEHLEAVGG